MFGYPIEQEKLLEMGANIGADVPFCMVGGTAYATGKGTEITPMPDMPDCFIVIARGNRGISTPWAFGELDRIYDDFSEKAYRPYDMTSLKKSVDEGILTNIGGGLYNIFENAVSSICPEISDIKNTMIECGSCAYERKRNGGLWIV